VHAEGDAGVNPVDHHEDAVTDATFECPVNLVSADGGCEFEVCDWTDYPDDVMGWSVPEVGRITDGVPMRLSRPSGPFRLRPGTAKQIGTDQQIARQKADNANARLQYKAAQEGIERGKYQFHEIKPVKMGGDPEAHGNKIRLLTADHTRVGRFWSKLKTAANRLARPGECQPPTGSGGDGGIGPTG